VAAGMVPATLEMKMKCGLGKCGRCNIGHAYVCKHGPVFSMEELKELPAEY
jgi:NAD(P)H-flavin reductase